MQVFDLIAEAEFNSGKLTKKNLFSSPRMFLDIYCLEPGQDQAVHSHAANDKAYLVIEGRVEITLGAERQLASAGHAVIAAAGVPHGVANRSASRAILAVMMAPHPSYDHEEH